MKVIKPPAPISWDDIEPPTIFLAGSIEQGKARDWQKEVEEGLKDMPGTILNPRRDDWDSGLEQSKDNEQFRGQVEWELDGQLYADIVAFCFDPDTQSPITLLELGMIAAWNAVEASQGILVYCPEGFWRKGNVDIVCEWFDVEQADDMDGFIDRLIEMAGEAV